MVSLICGIYENKKEEQINQIKPKLIDTENRPEGIGREGERGEAGC